MSPYANCSRLLLVRESKKAQCGCITPERIAIAHRISGRTTLQRHRLAPFLKASCLRKKTGFSPVARLKRQPASWPARGTQSSSLRHSLPCADRGFHP